VHGAVVIGISATIPILFLEKLKDRSRCHERIKTRRLQCHGTINNLSILKRTGVTMQDKVEVMDQAAVLDKDRGDTVVAIMGSINSILPKYSKPRYQLLLL